MSERLGEYVVPFGKFKGRRLDDIGLYELDSYLEWAEEQQERKGFTKISKRMLALTEKIREYLALPAINEEMERELEGDEGR